MAISQAKRLAIYERDGFRCLKCRCRTGLTIDHIRAKADGGTDDLDNLQTLCEGCNQSKGDGYEDLRARNVGWRGVGSVPQWDRVLKRVLGGQADANVDFGDLCGLLKRMGFAERIEGDHHIFTKSGFPGLFNLQPDRNNKAKDYQVRQVRRGFKQHGLTSLP